ncbi:glycosyltransferase family 1 protein [Vibrio sinensis]|uniref:Glycosyltransferase family 1 protein n=1 Tax=Vibrio sinensis TaxID=2302434 RepID=A0A3A6QIK7_9VIBR|nr:glycosyltransferase family 4 protein [Vibrio sinensis]RJX72375.1 glycosyltransferase family 1 protein [Vibrio sinensis]
MKICFILPSLSKKGPNIVAADIINSLVSRKLVNKLDVYYFNDSDGPEIDIGVVPKKISFFGGVDIGIYDVVHTHMLKPDLFVFVKKLLSFGVYKCKCISTLHQIDMINLKYDYNSRLKALLFSLIWRLGLSFHDKVICLSKSMRDYYVSKLIFSDVDYVYNGRDFSIQNCDNDLKLKTADGHFKIGTACLLTERKGLDQIIKVLDKFPFVHFYIAGTGPYKSELENLAHNYNVSDRVHFLGFVNNTLSYLKDMHAFTLPSRGEGFPLALLEAASLGLPCIVSDLDVISEAFTEDEVIMFELDNLKSLSDAIARCIVDGDTFGVNVESKYRCCYTSKHMADNYLRLYLSL